METTGTSQSTLEALNLIATMPAWAEWTQGDARTAASIHDALNKLSSYDLDTLRAAIARYVDAERAKPQGFGVPAASRIYVLVRYLFNSTNHEPSGRRRFASFHGIPSGKDWVDELWPLSTDASGRLQLTGAFGGYYGDDYLALQEFDAFRERFGPRKNPG